MSGLIHAFTRLAPWKISLLLGALVAGIAVAKYGVGTYPDWIYPYDLAANWQDPSQSTLLTPPADYLKSNFVAAWLAGFLGLLSATEYFIFHLALALIAIMLPFWMPATLRSPGLSRTLFIVVCGGPVVAFLLLWVNGYDAVTVIGLVIAALSRNPFFGSVGWLLAALNHTSIGIVALVVWIPIVVISDSRGRALSRSALALGGVAIGIGLNSLLMNAWGGSTSRLSWFTERGFSEFVDAYWSSMPIVIFSGLGIAWLLFLLPEIRSTAVGRILLIEALGLSLILPIVSLDATRTVGLGILAALLTAVVALQPEIERIGKPMRILALAAAIIPIPIVWSGKLLAIGWGSFLQLDQALQPPDGYVLVE